MNRVLIISVCLLLSLSARTQVKDPSTAKAGSVKSTGSVLSFHLDNGKYSFTYQNGMSRKEDVRSIVFSSKKEAKAFIESIGKAFKATDGTLAMVYYPNYQIRLLTELDSIFMVINEKNQGESTFKISKDNYNQINSL